MTNSSQVRLGLPFPSWPTSDRAAWEAAVTGGDPLYDDGGVSHWSAASCRVHAQGYGEWLSYLTRNWPEDLCLAPEHRVTRERIRGYLDEMADRPESLLPDRRRKRTLAPATQAGRILTVYLVIRAFAPDRDWKWLGGLARRLQRRPGAKQMKPYIPVAAQDLYRWALRRLEEVEESPADTPAKAAVDFRNFLAIAVLIACPVRRRAFCSLDVRERVEKLGDRYLLHFHAEDMKDGKARRYPLQRRLTGPVETYLTVHRPILLGGSSTDALWVTVEGRPMSAHSMYGMITRTTEQEFGTRLTVHDFRRIAATSIAEYDPEHAGIIRDILGHSTMEMADRYYNQAQGITAVERFQEETERRVRGVLGGRRL